jgi:hypothetical protein
MNQRTIPWGTVLAGSIALGLAVLVGLTEIAGVSMPIRSAGPGAVLVVGVLILLTGLVAVLRSGRSARRRVAVPAASSTDPAAPLSREPATPLSREPAAPLSSEPVPPPSTEPASPLAAPPALPAPTVPAAATVPVEPDDSNKVSSETEQSR